MSTSPRPDPGADPVETVPAHLPEDLGALVGHYRDTLAATPALDWVGHFRAGTLAYGVDRLGDPAPEPGHLPGSTRRDAVERLGRQVASTVRVLDRVLQRAGTGRLIRTVLSTDRNALICDTVRPGDDVIGVVPVTDGADTVEAGDRAVAALATRLRALDGLPAPNYGSFDTAAVTHPAPARARGGTGDVAGRLRAEIGPDGLHLLSYWADDRAVATADCLDDPALAHLADPAPVPAELRAFHTALAADLGPRANELNRATGGALHGRLLRLVLDVESGAVYYRRLPGRRHLVGVTLDQTLVAAADERMAALAHDLTDPGH